MAWRATADVERFDEAVEWFADRFPLTQELAAALGVHSGTRAWTIAGVAQLDVVLFVFESLQKAIELGTPFSEWQVDVTDKLTKAWGKRSSHRVKNIYRNATQQSLNAGRWRQMQHPDVKDIRSYILFDGISDARQSDICDAADGTVVHIDDPWLDTHSPQLHHGCRSHLRNIREEDARRRGITDSPTTVDAQGGFGKKPTATPWEPSPADYPPALFAEYQKKRRQLEKKAPRRVPKPKKKNS